MSNIFSNPVAITAAMASSYKSLTADAFGTFQYLRIRKIRWSDPPATAQAVITDGSGTILFQLGGTTAAVDIEEDFEAAPVTVKDFQVTSMSAGGTILIYLA